MVDLVYLWCNGADSVFRKKKEERLKDFRYLSQENVGDIRYCDNEELRYSLRSVYANIPWVNHIYIVTDNQVPQWLMPHPKITIVDHKEIIPGELLPTFSSPMIEMYINRIPGLAEKFLYLNDDVFIAKVMNPSDFFDGERPIVWQTKLAKVLSFAEALKMTLDDNDQSYNKTLANAWVLYCQSNSEVPYSQPAHLVDAFTKKIFAYVLKKYPQLYEINSQPFRTGKEIQRQIFSFEMIHNLGCREVCLSKPHFFNRLLRKLNLLPNEEFAVTRSSIAKLERDLALFEPKTFCLNNLEESSLSQCKALLNRLFPNPAPWE